MSARLPSENHGPEITHRPVIIWLWAVAVMVFLMVVVGGITRLTGSGLSMVEWRPLMGTLPPLSEAEWLRVFEMYKLSPEYEAVNFWMGLEDFKQIFFWEYFHRLLGRTIGLVFALPLVFFWITGRIPGELKPRLVGLFLLGGLQGGIGWWMVTSGLVDEPDVSQYRLAVHLSVAFVILGITVWTILDLTPPANGGASDPSLVRYGWALFALISITVVAGAFVAGTDAGFAWNGFPLMEGRLVPEGYGELSPFWLNWLENIAAIQFNHRILATLTLLCAVLLAVKVLRTPDQRRAGTAAKTLIGVVAAQYLLGVSALLMVVPVSLGAAHQGGAAILFAVSLWLIHRLKNAGVN